MKGLLLLLSCLILLFAFNGCGFLSCDCRTPATLWGGFLIDSNNTLHLLYDGYQEDKFVHLERIDGKWKKEKIDAPLTASIKNVLFLEDKLCIYYDIDSTEFYKTCKEEEGKWDTVTLKRPKRKNGLFFFENGHDVYRLLNGTLLVILNKLDGEGNHLYDEFFTIDENTGEKNTYLPDFDFETIKNYKYEGFEFNDDSLEGSLPFYENNQQDKISFIYPVKFSNVSHTPPTETVYRFHVTYDNDKWVVEKIYEEDKSLGGILSYLFIKNQKMPLRGRNSIYKRDQTTGKVMVEPFEHKEIYDKINKGRVSAFIGYDGYVDIIDQAGRIHMVLDEGQDFEVNLYYHVYNPASETPEKPEVREHIETRTW